MTKALLLLSLIFLGASRWQSSTNHFIENFENPKSEFFQYGSAGTKDAFKHSMGIPSPTEPNTSILSLKINPDEKPGAGKGPEIISKEETHFGQYATRLKVPDVTETQPNVGAVVGYFTYQMDKELGLSEIDFEWLIADPRIIYVGTWTGPSGNLQRIGRTINLAEGKILNTIEKEGHAGNPKDLTGLQNQPETIPSIPDYDASKQFYTYGFDWKSDEMRWWMIHPETSDTLVLWNYKGSKLGIPQHPSKYRMNFWHTNEWSVETNPNSLEKPKAKYEVEVDWMSYEPF